MFVAAGAWWLVSEANQRNDSRGTSLLSYPAVLNSYPFPVIHPRAKEGKQILQEEQKNPCLHLSLSFSSNPEEQKNKNIYLMCLFLFHLLSRVQSKYNIWKYNSRMLYMTQIWLLWYFTLFVPTRINKVLIMRWFHFSAWPSPARSAETIWKPVAVCGEEPHALRHEWSPRSGPCTLDSTRQPIQNQSQQKKH